MKNNQVQNSVSLEVAEEKVFSREWEKVYLKENSIKSQRMSYSNIVEIELWRSFKKTVKNCKYFGIYEDSLCSSIGMIIKEEFADF